MKRNYCAILLIFCALSAACESAKVENPSSNQSAAPANNSPTMSDAGQKGTDQPKSGARDKSNLPANETESTDFEGTAGITEKKYELRGVAVLEDVRVGRHNGFDRVVFEFEGAELPSYHVEYIDKPVRACGSGDTVPLKGDGWLEIRFSPANAHTEKGEPTIKNRAQSPELKIIRELKSTCDFEAEVAWVLGVSAPNRYRVLELKTPTRLAVDIRH